MHSLETNVLNISLSSWVEVTILQYQWIVCDFVPSRTFITMAPFLSWTILLTTLCLHVAILFPLFLLRRQDNASQCSYFVRVCFIWNQLPIDLLKIDNRNSFCRAALKHFCNTFQVSVLYLLFCDLLCNVVVCIFFLFCPRDSTLYRCKSLYRSFLYGKLNK